MLLNCGEGHAFRGDKCYHSDLGIFGVLGHLILQQGLSLYFFHFHLLLPCVGLSGGNPPNLSIFCDGFANYIIAIFLYLWFEPLNFELSKAFAKFDFFFAANEYKTLGKG